MYRTLLQNQVLDIKNPHLIQGSNLNDDLFSKQVNGPLERAYYQQLAPPSAYNVLRFTENSQRQAF